MSNIAKTSIQNALTVDVEDYFHVAAFSQQIEPKTWSSYQLRVDKNTQHILDMFDEYNAKATFFVLGWVAERLPNLVREIASRGHEIACHGYSHQLIYRQTPAVFRAETIQAKTLLEEQAQKKIQGYRAASYSITKDSLWAIDILAELGFTYDSSIFPIRHDRYGIAGSPRWPYRLATSNNTTIIEFPLSTVSIFGYRLPIAGGGYFRLYPYQFTRLGLAHINCSEKRPFIFYLHPWEIDPEQPRIKAGRLSNFRHYHNLGFCEQRLRWLLDDFTFTSAVEVIKSVELDPIQHFDAIIGA